MPALGTTMMIPGNNGVPHLFVVVWAGNIPALYSHPVVLLTNFDSYDPQLNHDTSCLISQGEHPFVQHDTFVNYRFMRCDEATHVDHMVNTGMWPSDAPVSPALLRRMRVGLCASLATKKVFKLAVGCP
jgi:hypothetical protein